MNNFENNRILAQENFVLSYLFTIFVHRVNDRQTILMSMTVRGEVPEWLNGHAWKACVSLRVPRVRIPLSPP